MTKTEFAEWKTLTASDGKVYEDPRPDMPEDSFLWLQLFVMASEIRPELCQNLIYMRSPGSRIVKNKYSGYVIRPAIDGKGSHGWLSEAQYKEYAEKWLGLHREELKELLARLENLFPLVPVVPAAKVVDHMPALFTDSEQRA
jgi:hypothetical protein